MNKPAAISLILILVICTAALAQEKPGTTFKIKVSAEQANIRDIPDIRGVILLQLPEGATLDAEKKEGTWYFVRFTREDGTSATGYIHESLVVPLEPQPRPPKTEPEKESPLPPIKEKQKTEPETFISKPVRPAVHVETQPPSRPPKKTVAFSILAGAGLSAPGDLNTGARGFVDYYQAVSGIQGGGQVSGLHVSSILSANVLYGLAPGLYATLGMDYLNGRRSSRINFTSGSETDIIQTAPRIQSIPIMLGLVYYPFPFLYVKGGLQCHFATCRYLYRREKGSFWQEWRGTAKAVGLGASFAVGGEWELLPGLYAVGEAGANISKIGGFKGNNITLNSEGESVTEKGTLYNYMFKASDQKDYPLVFIYESLPAGPGISNPEEALVNFGGLSLKIGIKIRL